MLENASGQDLKPFFKQWLYSPGHPQLNITWKYDAVKGAVALNITQTQNTLFDFPLEIAIDGKMHTIAVKDKTTTTQFPAATRPTAIVIDPNVNLLVSFEVAESN